MLRAIAALGMLALLVGTCGPVVIDPATPLTKAPYTVAPPTPALRPIASAGPGGPDRPYAADDIAPILAAAPVGFPSELRTPHVAAAIADRIWSFDGRPYQALFVGGSCQGNLCEFSVEGVPAFATIETADTWFLRLDLRTGVFSDEGPPSLRGLPPELVPALDALARSLDRDGSFATLPLIGAEWAIPPPDDAFVLRYGSGTEEQSVNWFVTISPGSRSILALRKQVM